MLKVSCICPTYNRAASNKLLLEEAAYSFLIQNYQHKELIILNDHPNQKIEFNHPQVKVINHPYRFNTLGEKYNYAIDIIATGDLICPWEDDDISLPSRLSISVEKIKDAGYFNPNAYFFMCGDTFQFEQMTGYAHNCSLFTRVAWGLAGKYPLVSGAQDAIMDSKLRRVTKTIDKPLNIDEAGYIYRWGVSDLHLSSRPDTQRAYEDYAVNSNTKGVFTLSPRWQEDYVEKVKVLKEKLSNGS